MSFKLKTGGAKAVTTAGTRVQLTSTDTRAYSLVIQALPTNTNKVYVGDVTVAASNGISLAAGLSVTLTPPQINGTDDELILSDIYIDSAVNGEQVTYHYYVRS